VPKSRVLVVEDFESFRRFVISTLQVSSEWQVVGEVTDGLKAVQEAQELQPDLILLDIGLPTLNGIEAARQIRRLVPDSKIVFLTQESSADLAQEAFRMGALGYVIKANAGRDLLAALETARQGRRFASKELTGEALTPVTNASISDLGIRSHEAHFYSDATSRVNGFAGFIETALQTGAAVIVVTTQLHGNILLQQLEAKGVACSAAIEQGRYIPVDAAKLLSALLVNDQIDPVRFQKVTGDLFAMAAKAMNGQQLRIAACGEAPSILSEQGKADAAVQLEQLWDGLAKTRNVDVHCGYLAQTFHQVPHSPLYERLCAAHSAVYSR